MLHVTALVILLNLPGARPATRAQEPGFQRLSAVWSGAAAPLAPGRYAAAVAIDTAPDGALWLLDGPGSNLQRWSPSGGWTRLLPLPASFTPRRLAATESWLWVLGRRSGAWQLLRLAPAGGPGLEVAEGSDGRTPVDLAARPKGGLAVLLSGPAGIALRRADGTLEARFDLSDLFQPGCARPRPTALAADGANGLWVGLARDTSACPGGPTPDPADPRPPVFEGAARIDLRGRPTIDRVEPAEAPIDLALRAGEPWLLGASGLQAAGAAPDPMLPENRPWRATALAWLADGRAVVLTGGCPEGAALLLDADSGPAPLGTVARPLDRTPSLPLRLVERGDRIQSLEGQPPAGAAWPDGGASALLLDWDVLGRPIAGRGLCAQGADGAWEGYLADLATADGTLWRLWPGGLERVAPPEAAGGEVLDAGAGWWTALAADGGRLALLDLAGGRVRALGVGGADLGSWPFDGLPVDIGLRGRYAYLADAAHRRVTVHDLLTGARVAAFGSHLPLLRLQTLADGGYLGLAAGDWALDYSADGRLRGAWPLEHPANTVFTDLLAGSDGTVTAARLRIAAPPADGDWSAAPVADAALDRYAPAPDAPPLPLLTAGEACVVRADKTLVAAQVALGGELSVRLRLDGLCPARPRPGRLMFLLDAPAPGTDRPRAAQGALATLLGRLDDERLALGLLVFQDGQILELPPGSDAASIRRLGLRVDLGRADLPRGIARAADRLGTGGGDAQLVLLLTHPPETAETTALAAALAAARLKGIAITALLYPATTLDATARRAWAARFLPGEGQLAPAPFQLPLLLPRLAPSEAVEAAFAAVTLRDFLPPGLSPVPGSVFPPDGQWDAAEGSLTWRRAPAGADQLAFGYRLRPNEAGPLAVGRPGGGADYRDGFGYTGRLALPLPRAEIVAPHPVYLPLLSRGACLGRRRPLELVLVLDLSSSMAAPAAGGGSKLDAARAAALAVLDLLDWRVDRVAVVGFSGRADLALPLAGDRSAVAAALAGLRTGEGTRIDLGLGEADRTLSGARTGARPVVILLTDGRQEPGLEAAALVAAGTLKGRGVAVYAIGLGADADSGLLQAIASDPSRYLASPDESTLAARFAAILRAEVCPEVLASGAD